MRKSLTAICLGFVLLLCSVLPLQAGVIGDDLEFVLQSAGPNEEISVIVTLSDRVNLRQFKDRSRALRRARMIRGKASHPTLAE